MNDEPTERPAASPFSKDTFADKAVRFGCGSLLAGLVFVALVFSGLGEPFGVAIVVAGGIVLVLASGVLSAMLGERYLEPLLRLIKWLG